MHESLRVAVIGAGYWGPNVIRTLSELPGCEIAYVCDRAPGRLQYVAERFPTIRLTDQFDQVIADPAVDAVAIVTPASTHRALAERALAAGKHVFVEKPLAATTADAEAIADAAARAERVLGVGHIFVYHPAVAALRAAVQAGELGSLCYAESGRVNLGPPASEVDVIWDLAVHDVSILLSLTGRAPNEVACEGRRYLHPSLTDTAFLTLRFADGFLAQHHVSWLSPVRVRRFFVAGSGGSATFDDTRETGKLLLSDPGIDTRVGGAGDAKELVYRPGEVRTPELPAAQPLAAELAHFLDCIRSGSAPDADGRAGLAVVRVLEAAAESVACGGRTVTLETGAG
jgi:predicted dehydrogenase